MNTISIRNTKSGRPSENTYLKTNFIKFFNDYYSKTINLNQLVNDDKLSIILKYEADDIVKNIETNISEHYIDHLEKLMKISFKLKRLRQKIYNTNVDEKIKTGLIKGLMQAFTLFKNDIKLKKNKKNGSYLNIEHVINLQQNAIPNRTINKSLEYDVKCNPLDYLKNLIWINKKMNELSTQEEQIKLFNITPLSLSFIPGHITLDTASLINILIGNGLRKALQNVNKIKKSIWGIIFKLDNKIFKNNGYTFNYMIKTDGVSCSLLFAKNENIKNGEFKKPNKGEIEKMRKIRETIEDMYIEENIDKIKENYGVNDPNFGNMLYVIGKNKKIYKYTRNHRNHKTKKKKYIKIRKKLIEKIEENEKELKKCNFKSCEFVKVLKDITIKNKLERETRKIYEQKIFRKLRLNTYINTQKSEDEMVKKIGEQIGKPKNTTIIYGDYSGKTMKGKEPLISKRIRRKLRNVKYDVFLINEFRTSILCNICEQKLKHFKYNESKRNKTKGKMVEVWGLLQCSNCKVITKMGNQVSRKYNRDTNACLNMRKIVEHLMETKERPLRYCHKCEL